MTPRDDAPKCSAGDTHEACAEPSCPKCVDAKYLPVERCPSCHSTDRGFVWTHALTETGLQDIACLDTFHNTPFHDTEQRELYHIDGIHESARAAGRNLWRLIVVVAVSTAFVLATLYALGAWK